MGTRDERRTSEAEWALIDGVSSTAAIAAGEEAPVDVVRDIETVRPMKQIGPRMESLGPAGPLPNARPLLNREEDGFLLALTVRIVRGAETQGRQVAVITEPFAFVHRIDDIRIAVIAPVRYETDFASIPGWARWAIASFGRHAEAAVIHDWLYSIGEPGNERARWVADETFRLALKRLGVGWFKRSIMHFAVRAGGRKAFGQPHEFRFRHLRDLSPVDPAPDKAPYLSTVAIAYQPGAKRSD